MQYLISLKTLRKKLKTTMPDLEKERDKPKTVISERADVSIREMIWDELTRKDNGATGPRPVPKKGEK